jgi:asparagine synthase (glutamine-hydrolysing)
MCGIAGIINSDGSPVDQALLRRMTSIMAHRGPDGDGFFYDAGVGLGHRRLSIIDLSGGRQPMSNEDQSIWISFNGEIYNFRELHKELEARGHRFTTVSDTETIVHAYEEYGDACVERLRGMFAFAIWDGRRRRLLLARDRIGIKPLYYYGDGRQFCFASELKSLLVHSAVPRDIDLTALRDYLVYGYIPLQKTIFQQIRKLLPGHYLVTERRRETGRLDIRVQQYWDLRFAADSKPSEPEWIEGLEDLLQETIKRHMISDVPLGAFLSGGLDSSCVVAAMAKISTRPVKTFSIGFAAKEFNEIPFARQLADRYRTEHHELMVHPDAIELLPVLARQFDEPFGDSSAIPTYYVSRLARQHVTVALSGDGGDEAFAGYNRYTQTMAALQAQRGVAFLPRRVRRRFFSGMASRMPRYMRGRGTVQRLGMSPCETYLDIAYFHDSSFLTDLLHSDIKASLPNNGDANSFAKYYEAPEADDLSRMQYLDTKTYLAEDILTKLDRASMLTSLEARVPLLDHKVLEFAARIPASLKFRLGEGKYIFRKLLRNWLPAPLLKRPKMGFGVPLADWFKTDLVDYTRDILFSSRSAQRGFFNQPEVERILSEHQQGWGDRSADIWRLLFLEHWCQHYLDSTSVS